MDEASNPGSAGTTRWLDRAKFLWRTTRRALPFVGVLVSALTGVLIFNLLFPAPTPPGQNEVDENIRQVMASATPPPPDSSLVYQYILPSLVFVQVQQQDTAADEVSIGSGVVVNDSGDVLTAYHVVGDAAMIEISFADGTQATAEIISADPEIDIAVLHPDRPPQIIVPAVLGNPGAMHIGDEAFAVGNPLGLTASMSAGVISGFDRSTRVEDGQRLEGLIQFDTAVNPGSSGGPLLNRQGQVVGIVTGLANPSEQNFFVGIGFAVPISSAVATGGGGPAY